MIKEMTEQEYQQLQSILIEKLSYYISKERNLFNFEFLDEIEEDVKKMIKTSDFIIFRHYDNIYEVIDNFETNISRYINTKWKLNEMSDEE